jgi:hypothetical protein
MTRIALLLAVAALALPQAAQAKGQATVRVCGPENCVTLDDGVAYTLGPAETVPQTPPTAAYYRVDVSFEAGRKRETSSSLFVPSSRLLAATADGSGLRGLLWYVPRAEALAQLAPAIRGLEPYEPPAAWPVRVERSAATEPAAAFPYRVAAGAALMLLAIAAFGRLIRLRQARTA